MPADWLTSVKTALDARQTPVQIFFRDDDAGWDDQRLYALLNCFRTSKLPIDLAVIPQSISQTLAKSLMARWRRNPFLLGFHQHGYNHINHQREGRKCEFGDTRSQDQQYQDLLAGRLKLEGLLAPALDNIFTPPWNRCSQTTLDSLNRLGFQALSRNHGATPLDAGLLQEIPVAIDWCGIRAQSAMPWLDMAKAVVAELRRDTVTPLGVMLHHAVMDSEDLEHLQAFLQLLAYHPMAYCRLMRELLENASTIHSHKTNQPVDLTVVHA